ncbi:efflux RND transporter permease subunit [Candidatus Entotheonella palauensis]|uniref:efflux RND transporter permease subunit n=1 Tax=Candidatus Entotheonella palauensis TaxID=93172 RepID=UPI000B7C6963|nr:efflux RND transporter permease subunit [Candidatus Entotheonella palauensis]
MWNLFYHNPRLLALTIALIMVSGLAAYNLLPRKEDPTLTKRNVLILTRFPGANAERVEALVTDKIEAELREMEEISELISTSRTNLSQILVELHDTIVNTDEVWSRVRDRLSDVTPLLPNGAQEPELDEAMTEIDAYTLITALTWERDTPVPYAIFRRLAESLEDGFRALSGTKHTLVTGAPEEEIRVEVDAAQLTALGLTSADVSNAIRRTDAKVSAGQLRGDRNDLLMEVEGQLDALEHVRRTTVQTGPDGQVVLVGDVAKVSKTVADPPSDLALMDGRPGVAVAVRMEGSRRIDQWAIQARATVEAFRQRLPDGIGLQIIFDQSHYVNDRLNTLERNLIWVPFF